MLDGTTLELRYRDNGCGFDPKTAINKGMGLSNIASRISSLNGNLEIVSKKGEGLNVVVTINTKQDIEFVPTEKKHRWQKR
jgi:signal transduction histidine kinase